MYRFYVGVLFFSAFLLAEVDLQTGIYDSADEIIAFDKKMNQVIEEHNSQIFEEKEEVEDNNIEDFEETTDGFLLTKEIDSGSNTKVKVSIEGTMLMIKVNTIESKKIESLNSVSSETIMSSSTSSLSIPHNADKSKMEQEHKSGILTIFFPKK